METKTLFDVAVGDYLIIDNRFGKRIVTVKHVTPTRFTTDSYETWSKKYGRKYGDSHDVWNVQRIRLPRDGEIEEHQLLGRYTSVVRSLKEIIEKLPRDTIPSQQLVDRLSQATELLQEFAVDGT